MAEALAVATFYLNTKPEILSRLENELSTVVKDEQSLPAWSKLEQLPYLISTLH
jgi:Cytochrome P450